MRTLKISLCDFQMQYRIIKYTHHAVHYIPLTYLFCSLNVVTFDLLHSFWPSLLPVSSNYQSLLCFHELGLWDFYFWETYARFMLLQNGFDCGLYFMNNKAHFVSLIYCDIVCSNFIKSFKNLFFN